MEGVAVDNLIDFDLPSEVTGPSGGGGGGGQHQGHTDIFSPEAETTGLLPEPIAPSAPNSHHHHRHHHNGGGEDGNNDSDATESADSENDMGPSSPGWELRRSSSSSNHSGEMDGGGAEVAERREFMKAYVEKIFHGR